MVVRPKQAVDNLNKIVKNLAATLYDGRMTEICSAATKKNMLRKKVSGEAFFFSLIPFYMQSVPVHSANCVNNV
jgi:hypothetical protein